MQQATLAQSVEQRIRNAQVASSSLVSGSQEEDDVFRHPPLVYQCHFERSTMCGVEKSDFSAAQLRLAGKGEVKAERDVKAEGPRLIDALHKRTVIEMIQGPALKLQRRLPSQII